MPLRGGWCLPYEVCLRLAFSKVLLIAELVHGVGRNARFCNFVFDGHSVVEVFLGPRFVFCCSVTESILAGYRFQFSCSSN